jgi:serine/threonine protein phosphatase PrpC
MLSDEEILDHAEKERDPQGLCRKLVDTANERGGVDNITVVVVRVPDGRPKSTPRATNRASVP